MIMGLPETLEDIVMQRRETGNPCNGLEMVNKSVRQA